MIASLVVAAWVSLASPGLAQETKAAMCNRTSHPLEAAIAAPEEGADASRPETWTTRGWFRLLPGGCYTLAPQPQSQAFYLHARPLTSDIDFIFGGDNVFCVGPPRQRFRIPGERGCLAQDHASAGFALAARGGQVEMTDPSTQYRSLEHAQVAGIQRLLRAIGADPGAIDGFMGHRTITALRDFQRAHNIRPTGRPNAATFEVLLAVVQRDTKTEGLTLCNSEAATAWVAIGRELPSNHPAALRGAIYETSGWFRIASGACTRVIAETLTQGEHFIHADLETPVDHGRANPQNGDVTMCVKRVHFRIAGRGRCTERGFRAVGFRRIDTGGASGATFTFTARLASRNTSP